MELEFPQKNLRKQTEATVDSQLLELNPKSSSEHAMSLKKGGVGCINVGNKERCELWKSCVSKLVKTKVVNFCK